MPTYEETLRLIEVYREAERAAMTARDTVRSLAQAAGDHNAPELVNARRARDFAEHYAKCALFYVEAALRHAPFPVTFDAPRAPDPYNFYANVPSGEPEFRLMGITHMGLR